MQLENASFVFGSENVLEIAVLTENLEIFDCRVFYSFLIGTKVPEALVSLSLCEFFTCNFEKND